MYFPQHTFTLKISATGNKADAILQTITLTACDVPDATVAASACSGQSPRVRHQGFCRANGTAKAVTMSWLEWFGKHAPMQVVTAETAEAQINALSVDERRKLLTEALAKLAAETNLDDEKAA